MKKLSFEDILKPGFELKAKVIEDKEALKKAIKECNILQDRILKQKEIDWNSPLLYQPMTI